MNLKKYLKRNLPFLKTAVENKLEVDLLEIKIKDSSEYFGDILSLYKEKVGNIPLSRKKYLKAEAERENNLPFGFMGAFTSLKVPENIYVNNSLMSRCSCFLKFLESNEDIFMYSGLHELTHLAHYRVDKKGALIKPKKLAEGFADYISLNLMKREFNLNSPKLNGEHIFYYEWFKEQVLKNNLKTAKDFKEFLKNFKKLTKEDQNEFKTKV